MSITLKIRYMDFLSARTLNNVNAITFLIPMGT